jgi:hypothetical protein
MQKDAEASLPPLVQGDPLILQMDDMVLPITWKFKYRYVLSSLITSLDHILTNNKIKGKRILVLNDNDLRNVVPGES